MKKTRFSVVLALLIWVGVARGQTPATMPECGSHPACKLLFDQAQQQSSAGQLTDALRSYKLAFEVTPDPRLLYSIARVFHKQGEEGDAIPYYRRFIGSSLNDELQKATARGFLAQCEAIQQPPAEVKPPPNGIIIDPSPKPDEPKRAPVHKQWWFWTVIGTVAAAGIIGGIVGGVTANQNHIPDPSFRPFESP